jgi:hypothetical protein
MSIVIPIISEFNSAGIDRAKKEFAQLEGAGAKAGYAVKKAAIPAAAAIAGLAAGLFDAAKGAMDDAAAQDLLAGNLRKATGATDAQIKSNEDWITAQGKLLGVTDDELRPVLSKLAKATGSVTKAQDLASAAMDIAASSGKPLASVTDALTKAAGGNFIALTKLAPEYRQMIKDGASFEEVMAKIAKTTGGAATEAANTAQGKFERLGVALSETKESIGAALLPAIEAVLPYLTKFGDWASKHPQILLGIGAAIATIAAAIVAVNIAMALNPFSLIAIAVVGLGALVVTAYNKFDVFREIVDGVFSGIKIGFELLKNYLGTLLNIYKGIFNGFARIWNSTIGKLKISIPDIPGLPGRGESFGVPEIPMLANGGIVTGPTLALIGEGNGPEAVIPLSRMGEFGMGGGSSVTINVNGGDPNAVVDALRRYMRQNGSVPIRVSNYG